MSAVSSPEKCLAVSPLMMKEIPADRSERKRGAEAPHEDLWLAICLRVGTPLAYGFLVLHSKLPDTIIPS
jgi:hypothetical protein